MASNATSNPTQDTAFEEYLNNYKIEHQRKYLPPFRIRRLKQQYETNIQQKHHPKNEQKSPSPEQTEHKQQAKIADQDIYIRDFYSKHSAYFNEWLEICEAGRSNQYIVKLFNKKHSIGQNQSKNSRSHTNIIPLFQRFYRYAIDIDNVCHYKQHLLSFINSKHNIYFLDIGFAPGGMSRFLLDSNQHIHGLGITLSPFDSGNEFIPELSRDQRFLCREFDVAQLVLKINDRNDFLSTFHVKHANKWKFPSNANGFALDFVIVGCTCHQDRQMRSRVDDMRRILLSELYLAFLMLKQGGAILMRHYNIFNCFGLHLLYILLKCFGSYKVGKPLTEFAKNKTFWILWKGFNAKSAMKLQIVDVLKRLLRQDEMKPYGLDPDTHQYNKVMLVDKTPKEIIDELKAETILKIMDPMFKVQMEWLKAYCDGKMDQMCRHGANCKYKWNGNCMRAHNEDECIDGYIEALNNVDAVFNEEIDLHKHHSKALRSCFR